MTYTTAGEESRLMQQCAKGDARSFQILFEKYRRVVFINALKFTKCPRLAEDMVQETFVRLWTKRHFLKEVQRFDSFLITISKNLIISSNRKVSRKADAISYFDDRTKPVAPVAQMRLEQKEAENELFKAIERLPPKLQEAFLLSKFDGLSHAEIAQRMKITKFTSQNYIARAVQALKKHLKPNQT